MKFLPFIILAVASLLLVAGCGKKSDNTSEINSSSDSMEVEKVNIDEEEISLDVQEQMSLHVDVEGVAWSSSDISIATVDQNGFVTGIRDGETTIVAEKNGSEDSCIVKVSAERFEISKNAKLYLSRADVENNEIDFSDENCIVSGREYRLLI